MTASSRKLLALVMMAAAAVLQATTATELEEAHLMILNNLEDKEVVKLHCMGEHLDFGYYHLGYEELYILRIQPTPNSEYKCAFIFRERVHMFDVYLEKRDGNRCSGAQCSWLVTVRGICLNDASIPENCYPWNKRA